MIVPLDDRLRDRYLRCFTPEGGDILAPGVPRKAAWYDRMKDQGLIVRVAVEPDGEVAGFIQAVPIEQVPWMDGQDALAILCLWVHGKRWGLQDHEKRGWGRRLVEAVEREARAQGRQGVAAWGLLVPGWLESRFFHHLGFRRVDRVGLSALMWHGWGDTAAPHFVRRDGDPHPDRPRDVPDEHVHVTAHCGGWCTMYDAVCAKAERVAARHDDVDFHEVDSWDPEGFSAAHIADAVFIDGTDITAGPPPDEAAIDKAIAKARRHRQGHGWWPFG